MKSLKRIPKPLIVVIVLAVILIVCDLVFGAIRVANRDTTYVPLSGRIFDLSQSDIREICVNDGYGNTVSYTTEEELQDIAGRMEDCRYFLWRPAVEDLISRGYDAKSITVYYTDGSSTIYEFENHSIKANGVVYYGNISGITGIQIPKTENS